MNTLKNLFRLSTLLIVSVTAIFAAKASDYDLPAVGGYDLVSYHQAGGPVRGNGAQTTEHNGVTYLFANEANKAAFDMNPDKYLPAYNGYCAYGVALGKKFNTDPKVYEVVDGTLYLNFDNGVQKKWAKDKAAYIQKADAKWSDIK